MTITPPHNTTYLPTSTSAAPNESITEHLQDPTESPTGDRPKTIKQSIWKFILLLTIFYPIFLYYVASLLYRSEEEIELFAATRYFKRTSKSIYEQQFLSSTEEHFPIVFPQTKKNFLAVCNQVKNEAYQIIPWIEFHLMVGVDVFYIYDHESTDGLEEVLEPYIRKGQVEYIQWPKDLDRSKWTNAAGAFFSTEVAVTKCKDGIYNYGCQAVFYADCVARNYKTSDFIAFFDVDEYMYVSLPHHLPPSKKYVKNSLKTFLQYFPYDNLRVNGPMFGGLRKYKKDIIIDSLRLHEEHEDANNYGSSHMFKSISRIRPNLSLFTNGHENRYGIRSMPDTRQFSEKCSKSLYNDGFLNIEKQFAPHPMYGMLRFNHYRFSELVRKKKYYPFKYDEITDESRKPFMKCTCDHISFLIPHLKERLRRIDWKVANVEYDFNDKGFSNRRCHWCDSVPFMKYISTLSNDMTYNSVFPQVDIATFTFPC